MKRLFNLSLDCTDYLLSNNVKEIAEAVTGLSDMAKTASVHSAEDMDALSSDEVAVILYHPNLGELKKFACDTQGITEININLLSRELDSLPEEVIKLAAGNLGYVAQHMSVEIPENLKVYQTGTWEDPYIDITHLNKVSFYQKLQDAVTVEEVIEKIAESPVDIYDRSSFSDDFIDNINARLKFTHHEKIAELYEDLRDNHTDFTPEQIVKVLETADNMGDMGRAISKGMFKGAEDSTYGITKVSWYQENIDKIKEADVDYLADFEKEALLGDEGEDIFNSLPTPTKDRLIKDFS